MPKAPRTKSRSEAADVELDEAAAPGAVEAAAASPDGEDDEQYFPSDFRYEEVKKGDIHIAALQRMFASLQPTLRTCLA